MPLGNLPILLRTENWEKKFREKAVRAGQEEKWNCSRIQRKWQRKSGVASLRAGSFCSGIDW
jgi:hypothetical protein